MTSPLDTFSAGYYIRPEPAVARDALLEFARSPNHAPLPVLAFAIAVAYDPRIKAAVEELGPIATSCRALLDRVFAASEALPDPATMPIREPTDLDALWAFFLATGAATPVQRIVDTLDSADLMSALVQQWLDRRGFLAAVSRMRFKARLLEVGLLNEQGAIPRSERDLDLHVWKLMSQRFQVRTELPFPLTDAYIQHLSLRGAACWSLQSNSQSHPLVKELYSRSQRTAVYPLFV